MGSDAVSSPVLALGLLLTTLLPPLARCTWEQMTPPRPPMWKANFAIESSVRKRGRLS